MCEEKCRAVSTTIFLYYVFTTNFRKKKRLHEIIKYSQNINNKYIRI